MLGSPASRAGASHPEIDLPSALGFADLGGESRDLAVCAVSNQMLTPGDVEAIADALAEKVLAAVNARSTTFALVDARELAHELGVSVDYVYGHKGRIRFDLDSARRALEARAQRSTRQRRRSRWQAGRS
jgi:hypothetical protein